MANTSWVQLLTEYDSFVLSCGQWFDISMEIIKEIPAGRCKSVFLGLPRLHVDTVLMRVNKTSYPNLGVSANMLMCCTAGACIYVPVPEQAGSA